MKSYKIPKIPTKLCELAFKYGTDKCVRIKHPFTAYYYKILKSKRKSIKKIIEIGVGLKRRHSRSPKNTMGASLYMWKDFFLNAQIYGADNDPRTMFRDGRIKTVFVDQSKKEDLMRLVEATGSDIDLVIDDASHIPELQASTCTTLMPLLKKNVVYIIEDVMDPSIVLYLKKYDYQVVEPNERRFPDDRLVVVRNKNG